MRAPLSQVARPAGSLASARSGFADTHGMSETSLAPKTLRPRRFAADRWREVLVRGKRGRWAVDFDSTRPVLAPLAKRADQRTGSHPSPKGRVSRRGPRASANIGVWFRHGAWRAPPADPTKGGFALGSAGNQR